MYNEKIPYLFIENTKDKSPQMRIPIEDSMDHIQVTIRLAFFNLNLTATYFTNIIISSEDGGIIARLPVGPLKMKKATPKKQAGFLNGIISPFINNPKPGNYMLSAYLYNDKRDALDIQHSYFSFVKKDDKNAK